MQRSKFWLFTWNNPTADQLNTDGFKQYLLGLEVERGIWQLEKGLEGGTPHLQGYVEFSKSKSFNTVRNIFRNNHVEARAGTREQAHQYCSKVDTRQDGPWGFGEWHFTQPGKRSDLTQFVKAIQDGKTNKELVELHPATYLRYSQHAERVRVAIIPPRDFKTTVIIHHGEPGAGKSYSARKRFPNAYWKMANTKWWDGYQGHSDVVMDDYNSPWISWAELMQIMDEGPCLLEVKGAAVQYRAKNLVITTNVHPCDWYQNAKKERGDNFYPNESLVRRIDEWWVFKKDLLGNRLEPYKCTSYEDFCNKV